MRQSKRFKDWFKRYGLSSGNSKFINKILCTEIIKLHMINVAARAYHRGLADGQKSDLIDKAMQSVLELGQSLKDATEKDLQTKLDEAIRERDEARREICGLICRSNSVRYLRHAATIKNWDYLYDEIHLCHDTGQPEGTLCLEGTGCANQCTYLECGDTWLNCECGGKCDETE
jgi:hypothetical protein